MIKESSSTTFVLKRTYSSGTGTTGPQCFGRGHTPKDKYPLLLHFHPLVIYRQQVIKQADMVLAMFLLNDEFSLEQKRHNFDYYDPLTTGDSSLSACIQAIIAMEVGHREKAWSYFRHAASHLHGG